MKKKEIKVVKKTTNDLPKYSTPLSAGCDVKAELSNIDSTHFKKTKIHKVTNGVIESIIIESGGSCLVPTGIYGSIPEGFEVQVRPRSGLALKKMITVLNSPGTIDGDYRGEWGVILVNFGEEPFILNQGERFAQLVLNEVFQMTFREVEELDETERGEGGFGHSDKKEKNSK